MATIEGVLAALDESGVRFVVVGGVAVVLHGHLRTTLDLDVVVDLEADNAEAALDALTEMGLEPRLPVAARDFANETLRRSWIEDRGMMVFSMWDPSDSALLVDLFVESPFPFEELVAQAKTVDLAGHPIRIASIEHLVEMKQRAGRPQDLADIDALRALSDE